MSVNDMQVGGKHYHSTHQHWDFVLNLGLPYLPAQITRYICRWRRKNGAEDLEKALHYLNKMIERELLHQEQASILLRNFVVANDLTEEEARIFSSLVSYRCGNLERLYEAREEVRSLLKTYEAREEVRKDEAQNEIDDLFSTKEDLTQTNGV
jgi:hypothetical protein